MRLALITFLLIAGCPNDAVAIPDGSRVQAIDQLAHGIAERGVPGIAIAVVRNGDVFDIATIGFSNLADHGPVSRTTPFQLASTTKVFSSVAILRLVAEGRVHLDDPIGNYLEELPATWKIVTVRQLLSHTSGLPDITRRAGELDLVADTWQQALGIVSSYPFQFRPGTGWSYTQTNYAIIQRLIERLSGRAFEDHMEQRLFRPLGMRNTFYPRPGRSCAANYERTQGRIAERRLAFPRYVHAAGGLCSSLADLIIWTRGLDSGRIIPQRLLEEARTPAALTSGGHARVAASISYGLGLAIDTAPGHRWAGHSGGNSTAIRQYLDEDLSIIVLHNGTSDPDAIVNSIARIMSSSAADAQANLWDAAMAGDEAAIEAALQGGANINALDTRSSQNGRFALNWAAINDRGQVVRMLIERGAAVNAQTRSGFTALHHAAETGSLSAAQALLNANADSTLRNANGKTAAEIARENGHPDVAQLLERARPRG